MNGSKKKSLWIAVGACVVLALLLILIFLPSRLINSGSVREKIKADVTRKFGCTIGFQRITLSFFPRPRIGLHRASLVIPGKAWGTLASVSVYPDILPILWGEFQVARLEMESPDFKMKLPATHMERIGGRPFSGRAFIEENILPLFASQAPDGPRSVVSVEKGRLTLLAEDQPLFSFQNIESRIVLAPDNIKMDITCNANLWESLSFKGSFDSKNFAGEGRIDLVQFQPRPLTDYLFPKATYRLAKSGLNLSLDFQSDGPQAIQANLEGSVPCLTFHRGNKNLVIKGKGLRGALRVENGKTTVFLTELKLEYPRLNLTGKLQLDQTSPRVSLDLEGRDVDVHSTREAALSIAGDIGAVRDVFHVVKGGKVPLIAFHTHGDSVAALKVADNILINGLMLGGKIGVPNAHLDLEDAKGEVTISKGSLQVENLEARLGNTRGHDGSLRVSPGRGDVPFQLDMIVEADLAQVPPLLKRWVKHKSFVRELNLIDDVKGNATGKLVVDGRRGSIKVSVDITKFSLSANYRRIPYPLQINGGRLFYNENKIVAKNLRGKLAKSSFSELSGRFDWENEPFLEFQSGKSSFFLYEVCRCFSLFKKPMGNFKKLKNIEGVMELSALNFIGPMFNPEAWRFEVKGEVKNIAVNTSIFPGVITVSRGEFTVNQEELSFTDAQTNILDASLNIAGILNGRLRDLQKTEFNINGEIGPEAAQWFSNFINLPPELNIRSPLSVSHAYLLWDNRTGTHFRGKLAIHRGPEISIDILRDREALMVNNLLIEDETSRASVRLNLRKQALDFKFTGNLAQTTLHNIFLNNTFSDGWIRGDFQTHILMDQPTCSTAKGKIEGGNLVYPWKLKSPVKINRVSLDATGNNVKLDSVVLTWADTTVELQGHVNILEEGLLFDVDVSADHIDWDSIKDALDKEIKQTGVKKSGKFWDLPVEGICRLKSDCLKYKLFTWSPLRADIFFGQNEVTVVVTEADLCGISTPGVLKISPQGLVLDFKTVSNNQELEHTLSCLGNEGNPVTGKFDLNGKINAHGKHKDLAGSLLGNIEFSANNGRIYRLGLLEKTFAFLNIAGMLKGNFPDMKKEGFAYNFITGKGNFQNGRFILEKVVIESFSMKIVCQGKVDYIDKKVNLNVLVAPLKTIDLMVKNIPLVNDILDGTLVSFPVKITGDLTDPMIIPLSPSAVGSELLGILKRIIKLPVKLIQLVIPTK